MMRKMIALAPVLLLAAALQDGHPDTTGWEPLLKADLSNAEYPKGVWTFKDGVLTATKDQCLWTRKDYENFILDVEFKVDAGANGGVIVYCSSVKNWIPNSVEVQITDDSHEKWAKSPPSWRCGAIFGHLPASKSVVRKPGEWNRYTITCRGQHITVVLNGEKVTEMDMSLWTSAKKNPDGSDIPKWLSKPKATLPTRGRVGFQGFHGGVPVYYRNMWVKPLEEEKEPEEKK
jgi:hypothetical protein